MTSTGTFCEVSAKFSQNHKGSKRVHGGADIKGCTWISVQLKAVAHPGAGEGCSALALLLSGAVTADNFILPSTPSALNKWWLKLASGSFCSRFLPCFIFIFFHVPLGRLSAWINSFHLADADLLLPKRVWGSPASFAALWMHTPLYYVLFAVRDVCAVCL